MPTYNWTLPPTWQWLAMFLRPVPAKVYTDPCETPLGSYIPRVPRCDQPVIQVQASRHASAASVTGTPIRANSQNEILMPCSRAV